MTLTTKTINNKETKKKQKRSKKKNIGGQINKTSVSDKWDLSGTWLDSSQT